MSPIDTGHIGFEVRFEHRNIETAAFGAEYQGDRIERTRCLARAMADAIVGADEHCLAVDEAQHIMMRGLRAGLDARSATEALACIDERMQRSRFGHTGRHRLLQRVKVTRMGAPLAPEIEGYHHRKRDYVNSERPVIHALRAQRVADENFSRLEDNDPLVL
jgi:hypothetical protein